jgi:hypothetical protein
MTLRVDYAEAALIQLLEEKMEAAYGAPVQVDSLGDKDYDDDGSLVLQPPCLRVRFGRGVYDNLRDNQRLTYQGGLDFEVLAYESSLRDPADERKQTLVLVAAVQDQLAGARLTLQDGSRTQPITMKSVALIETQGGPVDQLFSVVIEVNGVAQFSGVNAQETGGGV